LVISNPLSIDELVKLIVWSSTREVSTIFDVSPFFFGFTKVTKRFFGYIDELSIITSNRWNKVWSSFG
jgi:hypothetical protein